MEQFDWTPGSLMLLTKLKPSNMTLMTEQWSVRLVYGTLIQQRSVLPPRPRSPPGPRLKSPPGPNPPVQRSLSGETRWTTRSRRSRGTHWQTHSLILSMYNNSAPTERQALINIVEEVVRAWSQGSSVCWPPWLLPSCSVDSRWSTYMRCWSKWAMVWRWVRMEWPAALAPSTSSSISWVRSIAWSARTCLRTWARWWPGPGNQSWYPYLGANCQG